MLEITYWHTLYKREVTEIVFGSVHFVGNAVIFESHGRKCRVELEYVKSISPMEGYNNV